MATPSSKHSSRNQESLQSSSPRVREWERELGLVSRQVNIPEPEPEPDSEPDHQSFLAEASSDSDFDGDGDSFQENLFEADSQDLLRGFGKGSNLREKEEEEVTSAYEGQMKGDLQLESLKVESSAISSSHEKFMDSHDDQRNRRTIPPLRVEGLDEKRHFKLESIDNLEVQDFLQQRLWREAGAGVGYEKDRPKFSDLFFTPRLTVFDRHNSERAPFRGIYTLCWLGIFFMVVKIGIQNWNRYGSILGGNEILRFILKRDLIILGLTDGVLCASTTFSLLLQRLILSGYLSWNRQGWIIQNAWQAFYLAATIGWTVHRRWPWSHTVFIVMHCLVMMMKQHSYAFYNGYLSGIFQRRRSLEQKLKQLEDVELGAQHAVSPFPIPFPAHSTSASNGVEMTGVHQRRPSATSKITSQIQHQESELAGIAATLEAGNSLTDEQARCLQHVIRDEIESLTDELSGKGLNATNYYPRNLNIRDFAAYIPLPSVVYQLQYPRRDHINWFFVAEKTLATFGVLGVMLVVSQAYVYPVVAACLEIAEKETSIQQRLREFPTVFGDLLFPLILEYLLSWYVIWECVLNVLAELTFFADRGFYADWWNAVSWDQYSRDWNRTVYTFLLRHVYHPSIHSLGLSRPSAMLVTFLLSGCVHELIMWCLFKKVRGYLMMAQLSQLPMLAISKMRWMKGRKVLGNLIFWLGIFTGPSVLCALYLLV